jgi:dihydrofolate synthase/folylpolyglutamate synthase
VIDVAHNVASVEALCGTLDESFPPRPRVLVFAVSRDKDAGGMLRCLLPRFQRVIFTQFLNNPRSADPELLLGLAEQVRREGPDFPAAFWEICPDPASAWRRARELATAEHLICVTGSFFIAAEVQATFRSSNL